MALLTEKRLTYERLPLNPDDDIPESLQEFQRSEEKWRHRFITLAIVFVTVTIVFATGLFFILCRQSKDFYCGCNGIEETYSPAKEIMSYEQHWLTDDPDTPKFIGQPRPEMDQAWHNLLEGTLIRVSKDELDRANTTSIPLRDGGYAAGLGVSHDLHCLKRIEQYLHKDYYYEEPQDWEDLASHVGHCLESLRQKVMCMADTSLYTLKWTTHSKLKPAVTAHHPAVCVNFDALHEWMIQRAARMDMLVHPPDEFYAGYEYDPVSGTVLDSEYRERVSGVR